MTRSHALAGHFVQSATIVVGVLVALVLGSGWDYLADGLREREYEAGLLREFRNGRRELAADQAARAAFLDRTARLADSGEGTGISADSLPSYVAALVDFRFFTPSHPVLEDLIAGGNLELLRSDELRAAILRYTQERDRLQVVEERERRFVSENIEPYLVDGLPISLLPQEELYLTTSLEPFHGMIQRPAFQTLMALRWDRSDLAYRFATGLGFRIDDVIALLEQ